MKTATLGFLLFSMLPMLATADTGMQRVWVFESANAHYMVLLSPTVEQDGGQNIQPKTSPMNIYRETGGKFPDKPVFITKAICEFGSKPREYVNCSNMPGPFSGARFVIVPPKSADRMVQGEAKKYLADFQRAGKKIAPFGVYGHSIFQCVSGCDVAGTPRMMVEPWLMGD